MPIITLSPKEKNLQYKHASISLQYARKTEKIKTYMA